MMRFVLHNSLLPLAIIGFSNYISALVPIADYSDTSTATSDQSLIPSKTSNFPNPVIGPTCFPTEYFPRDLELDDCLGAGEKYKQDPYYSSSIAYEKNPLPGIVARKVPLNFKHRSCGIVLDAPPEAHADIFTLESGWGLLNQIITECIVEAKPGFKMGGCIPVGNLRGFFLAVGGRPHNNGAKNETRGFWEAEMMDVSCGRLAKGIIERS